MNRLALQCMVFLAAALLNGMANGTSIAKPAVVAHRLAGSSPTQYEIEVINITSHPAYLVVFETPAAFIDKGHCEIVLSTQANENDLFYSYSPEIRLLLPNGRTTFKWVLPKDLMQSTRCREMQLVFRVAYLLQKPTEALTTQYVAAHQILTESEAEDYP